MKEQEPDQAQEQGKYNPQKVSILVISCDDKRGYVWPIILVRCSECWVSRFYLVNQN